METIRERVEKLLSSQLTVDPTYLSMSVFGDEAEQPAPEQTFGTVFRTLAAQQRALLLLADELDKLSSDEPHG